MGKQLLGVSLLMGLGSLMVACGDSGGSARSACPPGEVSCDGVCITAITPTLGGTNGIQAEVFDGACAFSGCHGSTAPQASLELSSVSVSEQQLIDVDSVQVDQLRVAPGDSGASYLVNKLLNVDIAPNTQVMPLTGMLCEARIDAVVQWIDDGAPVQ